MRSSASCSLAVFFSQSMWGRGGNALGMTHLLSLRPASAAHGQERRGYGYGRKSRRVRPFTRTVGRLADLGNFYPYAAQKVKRTKANAASQFEIPQRVRATITDRMAADLT